jgi:hypothetical protein
MEYPFSECIHADTVFLMKVLARERVAVVDRVLYHYRARTRTEDSIQATHRPEQATWRKTPRARIDATLRRLTLDIARQSGFSRSQAALLRVLLPGLDAARTLRNVLARRMDGRA